MEIDIARDVLKAAFRSSGELQSLLGTLKDRCEPDQYTVYARGVAAAIDAIGAGLINKVLATYPELSREIDASIAKHGRYI